MFRFLIKPLNILRNLGYKYSDIYQQTSHDRALLTSKVNINSANNTDILYIRRMDYQYKREIREKIN